jgi:hypothetical protein
LEVLKRDQSRDWFGIAMLAFYQASDFMRRIAMSVTSLHSGIRQIRLDAIAVTGILNAL